ncbi:effector-associated constant component EACC1 [Labedaea rhizosphaerae]|uniref:effector-associated constant component EACC1 n=1 Tax=Labedaea rhizosphaerae TaxID=598644 RepID=UPI00105E0484|nr:hypothetical protein [Labedaea rhizosphaerae]
MTETTVLITVEGEDDALGLLRWLDEDFPGRVRLHDQAAGEGAMGPALDTVSLLITSGFTATTTALVAYLKTRGADVDLTVKAGDKSVTIKGKHLHGAGVEELTETAAELAERLGGK